MASKISQTFKQINTFKLSPQLKQAINLLAIPHFEMATIINQELTENPLLEEVDYEHTKKNQETDYHLESLLIQNRETTANVLMTEDVLASASEMQEWNQYLNKSNPDFIEADSRKSSKKRNEADERINFENVLSNKTTLPDYLLWQLSMQDLTGQELKIAETIIYNLNDDGYLENSIEEIATNTRSSLIKIKKIIEIIQHLDPIGCGCQNLQESLLVQARYINPTNSTAIRLLDLYFKEYTAQSYQEIIKKERLSYEELQLAEKFIKKLNPRPGKLISSEETFYIVPDVYIYVKGEEIIISLNQEGIPKLKISTMYNDLSKELKKSNDKIAMNYLNEKYRNADWLLKIIRNRYSTILKVTEAIVYFQKNFFLKGPQYLRPMVLRDIAMEINLHESTVSRATINKYIHTPYGILDFKYFFNSRARNEDLCNEMSIEIVKKKVKDLIGMEQDFPLSDQKIVDILRQQGIVLARRTVTKYRESMNILPSTKRKNLQKNRQYVE